MRCGRAQRWMVAAADAELDPRRRRALDRHFASCVTCRSEADLTARLLQQVTALPSERPVPARLEQATLRRVRLLAAEEAEGRRAERRWWAMLRVPALAVASVGAVAFAVGLYRTTIEPGSVPAKGGSAVKRAAPMPSHPRQLARLHREPTAPKAAPPAEPPPELAAAPDLFVDLPILRNMEKLEHFDAIRTTTLDEDDQSNG